MDKTPPFRRTPPQAPGQVAFVGAGPGDPELLTRKALARLLEADVVLYDRLVAPAILDLCPPSTRRVDVGKSAFGPATPQARIHALLVAEARSGARVVRLKSGDPGVFGRLDEEIAALQAAGLPFEVVPGITAASAAAAQIGASLTARTRNAELRLITGHDMDGFAEQDWRGLAAPGAVAAIYMGKRAARFLQGRLLMHGACPETPITLVEHASRPDTRVIPTRLGHLTADLDRAALAGPVVILFGLAPQGQVLTQLAEATA